MRKRFKPGDFAILRDESYPDAVPVVITSFDIEQFDYVVDILTIQDPQDRRYAADDHELNRLTPFTKALYAINYEDPNIRPD